MVLEDYLTLWRVSRRRIRSETDYRAFQAFQASLLLKYLHRYRVDVRDRTVLDLGSGIGGYSQEFARRGAKMISMDLMSHEVCLPESCAPVSANALHIPLQTESVEIVFCASLIEHVAQPEKLITEIERVLEPGGVCYLSFPPYLSPMGGHEYAPFHYLGEQAAIAITESLRYRRHPQWVRHLYNVTQDPTSFAATYAGWGLFKMTIGKAQQLLATTGFQVVDLSTRYWPVSFVRWPYVREVLTWHVQFLLRKPAGAREEKKWG